MGVYLALSNIFPNVFALNDTTKTWTFNTAGAGDYTYDSSLVTVDDSGARPITGVNKFANPDFSANNSSWSILPISGSTTPTGYIPVPGNSTFTTGGDDKAFLAMAYEAKYDANGDGDGDTPAEADAASACTGATGCTADSGLGFDYRDITSFDTAKVVSTANGAPIVHITQTQAISSCPSSYHLISNTEWMTIARNAEAQASNWADGTVGSTVAAGGGMFRGNVGETTSVGYNGADPEYGIDRDSKAKLILSNGSEIWDMSGNTWSWNSDTITAVDQPDVAGQTGFAWREYTALTGYGSLSYDLLRPAGTSYNADYGVGRIYHYSESASATEYAFLRGGSWYNTSYAGAFALRLKFDTSSQYSTVGFRCASDHVDLSHSYSSSLGRAAAGGDKIIVGSISDAKVTQSVNVGDTSTYDLSAYAYDNTAGSEAGTVSSSVAQLYYNGATVTTTYTDQGSGWWKLTGQVTGANESRNYGILVKSGKNSHLGRLYSG